MKCPECGKWNRASFPVCQYCGTPLNHGEEAPAWRTTLKDDGPAKSYIRVDEDGYAESTPDARDQLAKEIAELKLRKAAGSIRQRRMRSENQQRDAASSNMTMQTEARSNTFWDLADDPTTTVQPARPARNAAPSQTQQGTGRTHTVQGTSADPFSTSRSYDPMWSAEEMSASWQLPKLPVDKHLTAKLPSRRRGFRNLLTFLLIIVAIGVVGMGAYLGIQMYNTQQAQLRAKNAAIVTASIKDDLAAHTIRIPGEEGAQIYIRELHTSYIVTGGYATVVVADHIWYDGIETIDRETLEVTLTPFLKTASGKQQPLDPINYTVTIPLSPITLITPSSNRHEVATQLFTIEFEVRPGSIVTINDKNLSDTVSSDSGLVSYNATVQPNGDNKFVITCRSQYCRENKLELILYREPQEIALDLAANTALSTSDSSLEIVATTVPGAYVEVLSPHSDLNISKVDTTGEFSFYAMFDRIGHNTITITSSMPGRKTSVVNYEVYYVPTAFEYTPKAWPTHDAEYNELLGNIQMRADRQQIYVIKNASPAYFVSNRPQMAVFYAGENNTRPILLENFSNTVWDTEHKYDIYADVYGSFDSMPWMCARYTYTQKDPNATKEE